MRSFICLAESLESRRLLSDASALDPSFGISGVAAMIAGNGEAKAIAQLGNGRIAAVAELTEGTGVALAIFRSDGTIETSNLRNYGVAVKIADMVIDSAGRIVIAGTVTDAGPNPNVPETLPPQFLVLRFNPNLTPDKTFGTNGAVRTDWSDLGFAALGRSLAISSTGKITVAGLLQLDINSTVDTRIAVAQYNTDGSPNNAFEVDGRKLVDTPGNQQLGAVDVGQIEMQSDGKALVVGTTRGDMLLVRYNVNGTLDKSFSTDGLASADIAHGTSDFATSMAIQSDGKIVIAGGSQGENQTVSALARYNTNGSIDTSFGTGGIVIAPTGLSQDEHINRMALKSDGTIVAGGLGGPSILLAQFDPSGALETDFGDNGFIAAPQAVPGPGASDLLLQPDDKIVIGTLGDDNAPVLKRFGRDEVALTNDGQLIISGTGAGDVIRILRSGTNVRVVFNGSATVFTSPVHSIDAKLLGGDDVFTSSLGLPTTVDGATGNDSITTGDGADTVFGAAGNDTISTGGGNDTVSSAAGRDVVFGGEGDDFLTGGAAADNVNGDAGNDIIWDYGGDNGSGGDGDDTFSFAAGDVTASGGNGNDTITGTGGGNVFSGDVGNDSINGGEGNELVSGGEGNDVLRGNDGNDTVIGNAGADTLYGGVGADLISGNGGKDHLAGEGGKDRLYGGDAVDAIDGGASDDKLFGQAGDDKLNGGQGNDSLDGGDGVDQFIANLGNDQIFSRDDIPETLDGGTGEDHGIIDTIDTLISVETNDQLFQ